MSGKSLLYRKEYPVNDVIRIRIPTVGEILDKEEEYYTAVSMLTAMPIDMMVQLDDIGVDFTAIDEYELFLLLFGSLKKRDTSLVFSSLDLSGFQMAVNGQNGMVVLRDAVTGAVIDRAIHDRIAGFLRKLHHIEKDQRKPANKEAKEYMLLRQRQKLRRRKGGSDDSQLERMIIAAVNTEQFHYGFEGTRELTIYQFNESLRQINRKINYDNRMHGVYAGTVSAKELSQDDLSWIGRG